MTLTRFPRPAGAALAAATLAVTVTGCDGHMSKTDAAKIACPLMQVSADASIASRDASVRTVEAARKQVTSDSGTGKFLDAAVIIIRSGGQVRDAETRAAMSVVSPVCADNGAPLAKK